MNPEGKWHREQLEQALAGLHGDVMRGLMAQLKDLRSARALVDFISARDWSRIDRATRAIALHQISIAIVRLRESQSIKPFDDPLPGAPPNAFQIIRGIITSFPQLRGNRPNPEGMSG